MTATLLTPDLRRILAALERRLGILERRITGQTASVDDSESIIFSYAGALVDGTTSPPIRTIRGGILAVLVVMLGTAGSTDTIILVERNGTTVATVTVPASTEAYEAEVGARFLADSDALTLTIDTAGTGAADMTADARFT